MDGICQITSVRPPGQPHPPPQPPPPPHPPPQPQGPVSLPGIYPNSALRTRGMLECLQVFRPPVMPFKALTELSNRLSLCTVPAPSNLPFSQEELDYVLYGCISSTPCQTYPRHALSGLRLSDMTNDVSVRGWNKTSLTTYPMYPPWRTSRLDPPPHVLPEELCIYPTMFAGVVHYGVFCRKEVVRSGIRYGPFKGKIVNTSEIKTFDDNTHMWEIFKSGRLSHFVDGRGALGNWMSYVNCARHKSEQNLVVVQHDDDIFYEVCRDIHNGNELLVWYGDNYMQFMGIPVTLHDASGSEAELSRDETENSEGYQCERCGKVFAYKYYRDKHLKYTKCVDQGDRKFPCHLCTRSFEKRDRLRIHVLHVHEKHRPHKCSVCGKSFSQSSSLNKHMRVHSGERPYKCVYCSKAFTASSILRTHIRQHSGERPFKCKYCGKAFASHAAHDSHVRRTHARDKPLNCKLCGVEFQHQFDLKLHYRTHSDSEPLCRDVMWNDPNCVSSPADVDPTS